MVTKVQMLRDISSELKKHHYFFTQKELSEIFKRDRKYLFGIWKNCLGEKWATILNILTKRKVEIKIFYNKKFRKNRRIKTGIFLESKQDVPLCKNCGIFDEGALKTGKCPNCDENYFKEEEND